MSRISVLIVDDDAGIRDLIQRYLLEQGLAAYSVADALSMDAWLETHQADILVLDLMLPGEDGLSIARRLHSQTSPGILMLSARGEDIDRIIGLEVGADDYLAKPFNPRELLARIRALYRRQIQHQTAKESIDLGEQYCFTPYCINFTARTLLKDEQLIALTRSEFELLKILISNPNRVLTRDFLMTKMQGHAPSAIDRSPFDRSIDVCISRIRRKMGDNSNNQNYIETIRSVGYRFNAPDHTQNAKSLVS